MTCDTQRDTDRQCAVSSCRAPSLSDTTPLDVGGERVEVDLCPYHAGHLLEEITALYDAAGEIDEIELEDENEDASDELERLKLIETAAHAVVALAATTEPAWIACQEYQALRVALGGAA